MTTAINSSSTYAIQLKFSHALSIVRAIPPDISELQPVVADKLQFYGLYKQATQGDINTPRPSSRQVVEYAKWKVWHRMKGMSPLEAQKLYIDSLIQLLTELIHRYPHHQYSEFLIKALNSLQCIDGELEEDIFQDAYDPVEFEENDHFLNHIDPQHITQSSSSPPSSFYHRRLSDQDYYPPTPITSPGKNISPHETYSYYPVNYAKQQDIVSEGDTLDREVAAATTQLHQHHASSSSSTSAKSSKGEKKKEERAFERLQTEITALTEQIDRLRQQQKGGWTMGKVMLMLLKHALADSALLFIIFLVLWKRKSPLAYAIIARAVPFFQALARQLVRTIVFWRASV
ncbi:hypothetical protein G6F37_006018 [Rhizopus arrhizus]|nr:hypothetical protein G6F38_007407 [Rhizopus arrhizus]KAG1158186.1 hypothetical protein G6F37_006018 [Rhizopus arrhizus]